MPAWSLLLSAMRGSGACAFRWALEQHRYHSSSWTSYLNTDMLPLYLQAFCFLAAMLVTMQLSPKQDNCMNVTLILGNFGFPGLNEGCGSSWLPTASLKRCCQVHLLFLGRRRVFSRAGEQGHVQGMCPAEPAPRTHSHTKAEQ